MKDGGVRDMFPGWAEASSAVSRGETTTAPGNTHQPKHEEGTGAVYSHGRGALEDTPLPNTGMVPS